MHWLLLTSIHMESNQSCLACQIGLTRLIRLTSSTQNAHQRSQRCKAVNAVLKYHPYARRYRKEVMMKQRSNYTLFTALAVLFLLLLGTAVDVAAAFLPPAPPLDPSALRSSRQNSHRCRPTSMILSNSRTTTTEIPSRQLVVEGMELFSKGDIQGSIDKFDTSVPVGSKAYLWQRGLSYYYANEFTKGSQQFKDDVLRSPLDVEEIVWDIACLLRLNPNEFPPSAMMSLPAGMKDRRPIMGTVYNLFRGEATEQDLANAGHRGSPSEQFYALLYLGLFAEARGENSKAENYMRSAVKTSYARSVGSRDYMVDVAKVHCQLRHWVV